VVDASRILRLQVKGEQGFRHDNMSRSGLIAVFNRFPKELFRVNNGPAVKVRSWRPNRYAYDIVPENGFVKPKALDPLTYVGQSAQLAWNDP
jgi:hypothetical protein